jgi:hypothetical protein
MSVFGLIRWLCGEGVRELQDEGWSSQKLRHDYRVGTFSQISNLQGEERVP